MTIQNDSELAELAAHAPRYPTIPLWLPVHYARAAAGIQPTTGGELRSVQPSYGWAIVLAIMRQVMA